MAVDLPADEPRPGASISDLRRWASTATWHEVEGTWRPGRSARSALVVRLADGAELFFSSIAEACRPDTFQAEFLAADGVSMPEYSKTQVRRIVGVLMRMAEVGQERDEREQWAMVAEFYLRAALSARPAYALDGLYPEDERQVRIQHFYAVTRYAELVAAISEGELPRVAHLAEEDELLLPRGPFQDYALMRLRGNTPQVLGAQMQRQEWVPWSLRARHPDSSENVPRPHVRVWRIPNGWDGLLVEKGALVMRPSEAQEAQDDQPQGTGLVPPGPGPPDESSCTVTGPAVPPGPASTSRAYPRDHYVVPGGTTGPMRVHESNGGESPR